MPYEVSTAVFEGPLDLLLHLILREQVDIYEVSLTAVVDGTYDFRVASETGSSPRLSVSTPTADSGEVIQVSGRGFTPHEYVQLSIGDDDLPRLVRP